MGSNKKRYSNHMTRFAFLLCLLLLPSLQGFSKQKIKPQKQVKSHQAAQSDAKIGTQVRHLAVQPGVKLRLRKGQIIGVSLNKSIKKQTAWRGLIGSNYVVGDIHATDVTPLLWRKLDVRLTKKDGYLAEIQMIRPLWWLKATKAREGGYLDLSVPEAGFRGIAKILSIQNSKADSRKLKDGQNLVISKIKHHNVEYIKLFVSGQKKPIGITPNHLVFSKTRNQWIPAGKLAVGERLKTQEHGFSTILSIERQSRRATVHNLEVHRAKSYYIGKKSVLAHNTGLCPDEYINIDTGTVFAFISENSTSAMGRTLRNAIGDRQIVMTSTAYNEALSIAAGSGPRELARLDRFLSGVKVIDDFPSMRVMNVASSNRIGINDKLIFGTADRLGIKTITSDRKFVRALKNKGGFELNHFAHNPVPLAWR